jgi:hypothetical protein
LDFLILNVVFLGNKQIALYITMGRYYIKYIFN